MDLQNIERIANMLTYLFPWQDSQRKCMGGDLLHFLHYPHSLFPSSHLLRDVIVRVYTMLPFRRIGSVGGFGTPLSTAAVFILGEDFILTCSINQCTVEAGSRHSVKDLLEKKMGVRIPPMHQRWDMYKFSAKVQVVRKDLFFTSDPTCYTTMHVL
jgi:hypothetical protein